MVKRAAVQGRSLVLAHAFAGSMHYHQPSIGRVRVCSILFSKTISEWTKIKKAVLELLDLLISPPITPTINTYNDEIKRLYFEVNCLFKKESPF